MTHIMDRSTPRRLSRPSARTMSGSVALIGAALVAAGVTLPWLSFFAGLQPVTTVGSPTGTLLFVGAAVVGLLGLVVIARGTRWARRGLTIAGIALTGFSAYLVVGLIAAYREASVDPLVVAQLGPGLAVVVVGALLVLASSFAGD